MKRAEDRVFSPNCLTASKPVTPRAIASLTPAQHIIASEHLQQAQDLNSRLPGLPMRASSRGRSVANSYGSSKPTNGAA